jgi:hypothetical protein
MHPQHPRPHRVCHCSFVHVLPAGSSVQRNSPVAATAADAEVLRREVVLTQDRRVARGFGSRLEQVHRASTLVGALVELADLHNSKCW